MSLYERLLRPLLFRMDPERAHALAMVAIVRGFVTSKVVRDPRLEQTLFGLTFPNPLGLAAGFDKNGVALSRWKGLGFGTVEVGTVTRLPQPGNPRPRLFRLPTDKALINRLGFNNDGSEAVATRVRKGIAGIPIGVNIGKSRVTSISDAPADYAAAVQDFAGKADYFVVNVSSPNTPQLRSLQDSGPLTEILQTMLAIDTETPLFVKVSPDLSASAFESIVRVATECGITGIVATNTTLSREGLSGVVDQPGGLSGAPLKGSADEALSILARTAGPQLTLIGVGGVFTGEDVATKLRLGASLAQIYTGWVYRGPSAAPRILAELLGVLERDRLNSVSDLIRRPSNRS